MFLLLGNNDLLEVWEICFAFFLKPNSKWNTRQ